MRPVSNGTGDGSSWDNASNQLGVMLEASNGKVGDQVWVAAGTYTPSASDSTISFQIPTGVKVYGGFSGVETSISMRRLTRDTSILSGVIGGGNSFHVVRFANANGSTLLDGFKITGGNAKGTFFPHLLGGGIYNDGSNNGNKSNPVISNCTFSSNSATYGGALYNAGFLGTCSPTLMNCIFLDNIASTGGGAVYNDGFNGVSNPSFTNCHFSGNRVTGGNGGAIYNFGDKGVSNPIFTGCTMSGNIASFWGGALYNDGASGVSSPILANCIVSGNTANSGGGIANNGASGISNPIFTNCTILGNYAAESGGGMYNNVTSGNSSPILTNCTLSGNYAPNGGGLYNTLRNGGKCSPVLQNSICWGNSTEVVENGGSITNLGNSIVRGRQGIDPLFISPTSSSMAPATGGDYQLQPCSQVIDLGDNSYTTLGERDLNEKPRIFGGANGGVVDIGAYEFQGVRKTPPTINISPKGSVAFCGMGVLKAYSSSGSGSGYTYLWSSSGDASYLYTTSNATVNKTGVYIVITTDGDGCTSSAAQAVTVNPIPTPTIIGLSDSYCQGDGSLVTLTGNPKGGVFKVDTTVATGFQPSAMSLGMHSIGYHFTDENGCVGESLKTIQLNSSPIAHFSDVVQDNRVVFSNQSLGGSGYFWRFGDSLNPTSAEANPVFVFPKVGAYKVTLVVTSLEGCKDSISQVLNVLTGVEDIRAVSMKMYPNPVGGGEVYLESRELLSGVEVYDLRGALVLSLKGLGGYLWTLRIGDLVAGAYVVKANFLGGGWGSLKLVKL